MNLKNLKKILFLLLILSFELNAQNAFEDSLINRKEISWIGSIEVLLPFDVNVNNIKKDDSNNYDLNAISIISLPNLHGGYSADAIYNQKFLDSLNSDRFKFAVKKQMDVYFPFAYYLYKNVLDNKKQIPIFKDADLKIPFDSDFKKDTVTTSVSENQIINLVINELNPKDITILKAKLYLCFNSKNLTWSIIVKSIAPVLTVKDTKDSIVSYKELFWIEVYNSYKYMQYSDSKYTFSGRSSFDLTFGKLNNIKNFISSSECNRILINSISADSTQRIYENFEENEFTRPIQVFSFVNALKNEGFISDNSNPEKGLDKIKEISSPVSKVDAVKIVQDWFWDNNEKKLRTLTYGFSPLIKKDSRYLFYKKIRTN